MVDLPPNTFIDFQNGKYTGQLYRQKQLPHGYGMLIQADGSHYQGDFFYGQKNGQGQMFFSNGDYYTGQFKKNKFHGLGKLEFSDGSFFQGNFFYGKEHGKGVYRSPSGHEKNGHWDSGVFVA